MNDLARIRFDRDEKFLTATIAGEIDISNTSELRRSIDAQLQLADTTTVIIDLERDDLRRFNRRRVALRHGESASHDP